MLMYSSVLYYIVLIAQYCPVLYSVVLYCTVWCRRAASSSPWLCTSSHQSSVNTRTTLRTHNIINIDGSENIPFV